MRRKWHSSLKMPTFATGSCHSVSKMQVRHTMTNGPSLQETNQMKRWGIYGWHGCQVSKHTLTSGGLGRSIQGTMQIRHAPQPWKMYFWSRGGKFLGFIITHRGIEANPNKCISIQEMCSPTRIEEVQKWMVGYHPCPGSSQSSSKR